MFDSLRPLGLQHARRPSLSPGLPKFVSIDSVMLSNHLILCCPLLHLPSIFPSMSVFSNEWAIHIAAAAKSLQSYPTLCDPIDSSPPGSPVPGILQARTLEWAAISFSNAWKWKVKVKSLSRVRPLATPWTAAYQAPPSMGFSRQEYWRGVPLVGGQNIGASASASILPMSIQDWFPLGLTGLISLQSRGLSRVSSSITIRKHQFFSAQPSLWSISHIHTWPLEKP